MRIRLNRFASDLLRGALAAMLLVAAVAGARLEAGMAGARAAGLPAVAVLCSGVMALADDAGAPNGQSHCVDCTLPGGLVPVMPMPAYAPGFTGRVAAISGKEAYPDFARVHYSARAPPEQV